MLSAALSFVRSAKRITLYNTSIFAEQIVEGQPGIGVEVEWTMGNTVGRFKTWAVRKGGITIYAHELA